MLKKDLNQDLFSENVEEALIRKGFGDGLLISGEKDSRVVALCADLTDSTQMKFFKDKFPDRFIEMGIAEQNLASVASGLSAMGKIPVISSYAMFSPGRNWEQIRTTIAYNDRKVVIAGSHAGVSVGPDGGTHQALEDIALMRVVPNMTVVVPCDYIESKKAIIEALDDKIKTPVYIRLAREKTPIITTEETPFEIGKAEIFYESTNPEVTIFACGALLHKVLFVAKELQEDGIGSIVVNISSIKPLDEKTILSSVKKTGAVVSVEEHQIVGGMGSAIAECLAKYNPLPQEFVGVKDFFGQSGKPEELLEHYNMGIKDIKVAVEKVLKRKS